MTTGTYAGILYYQDRADDSSMTITGSGNATTSYGGVIYAPKSDLMLKGSSDSIAVKGLVVGALSLTGSAATVNVG